MMIDLIRPLLMQKEKILPNQIIARCKFDSFKQVIHRPSWLSVSAAQDVVLHFIPWPCGFYVLQRDVQRKFKRFVHILPSELISLKSVDRLPFLLNLMKQTLQNQIINVPAGNMHSFRLKIMNVLA